MGDESQPLSTLDPNAPTCVHHRMLGDSVGNQIPGVCRQCGARRLYSGSIEGTQRFDDYREITAASEYYAHRVSA